MKHTLTIEGTADEIRTALDNLTGRADAPTATTTAKADPAPSVPAATETTETKAAPTGDAAVDGSGMPYNEAIHASPPSMKTDGTWKVRKGQAAAAKTARQAFLAGGAGVTAPVVEETKAAPGLPGGAPTAAPGSAPGAAPIPERAPVSLDEVMGKATQMFNDGDVDSDDLGRFYNECVGTPDPAAAYGLFQTNETARAKLMDLLTENEGG